MIFFLSSLPNHSGKTVDFYSVLGVADFLARKACHLAEYSILMALVYRAVQGCGEARDGHLLVCFAFVLLFAVSDEWHQRSVFGRNGPPFEVFVDRPGGFAG